MASSTFTRVAIFTIFALFIGIALLSIDSNQEEKRRLSKSNQLIGQGSLLNTRQKVGACSGIEVKVSGVSNVNAKGDTFTKNDLYLKVSPKPEGRDTTKVKWNAGKAKKFNRRFCWTGKVSKVTINVMDKDWVTADDLLDTVTLELKSNGKQVATGEKGSKVSVTVKGVAEKEEEKPEEKKPEKKKEEEEEKKPEEKKEEEKPEEPKKEVEPKKSTPKTEEDDDDSEEKTKVPKVVVSAPKEENKPDKEIPTGPFYWTCPGANKGKPFDRIRKDYNDLTKAERELYIKAVQTAKKVGKYDIFVALHKHVNNDVYAHSSSGFYPWHRKFLVEYENMLRSVGDEFKCVTIPFYDWAQEAKVCHLINSKEYQDDEHDDHKDNDKLAADDDKLKSSKGGLQCNDFSDTGFILNDFGGKGTSEQITEREFRSAGGGPNGCVKKDGPFGDWKDFEDRQCLARGRDWTYQRGGQARMPLRTQLAAIIKEKTNYRDFFIETYGAIHGMPHVYIGGHMARMWSPQDPIFFSHHAFIDKLWYNHQDCHDHKNKDAAMWQNVQNDRYRIPTSLDQELPFCLPKKFAKMSWAKSNKGLLAFLAGPTGKNTHWCGERPKSRYGYVEKGNPQMTSKALSSWTDNYRLGDYVDSHKLPGEGNNVMYWPDEYDRIVADKLNGNGICSLTKIQRDVGDSAKSALALMETEEMTEEKMLLQHHALIDAPHSKKKGKNRWGKIRGFVKKGMDKHNKAMKKGMDNHNKAMQDGWDRHNKAMENWAILKRLVLAKLRQGVEKDITAFNKGGISAAVENECKDAKQWDDIKEESLPMKVFGHWFPNSKKQIAQGCFDKPITCPVIGQCKKLRMKKKLDDKECNAFADKKAECVKQNKCVWLRDTKNKGKGKCV